MSNTEDSDDDDDGFDFSVMIYRKDYGNSCYESYDYIFPVEENATFEDIKFNRWITANLIKNCKGEIYHCYLFAVDLTPAGKNVWYQDGRALLFKKEDISFNEAITKLLNFEDLELFSNAPRSEISNFNGYFKVTDPEIQPRFPDVVFMNFSSVSSEEILEEVGKLPIHSIPTRYAEYINLWNALGSEQKLAGKEIKDFEYFFLAKNPLLSNEDVSRYIKHQKTCEECEWSFRKPEVQKYGILMLVKSRGHCNNCVCYEVLENQKIPDYEEACNRNAKM